MWSRATAPLPPTTAPARVSWLNLFHGKFLCLSESFATDSAAELQALVVARIEGGPQRVAGASGLGGAGERPREGTALLELRWRAGFVGTPTQIQVITPPPPSRPPISVSLFSDISSSACSGQLARSQHGLRRRVLVTKMPEQPPHPGHCFEVRCERAPAISSFLSFLLFCFS